MYAYMLKAFLMFLAPLSFVFIFVNTTKLIYLQLDQTNSFNKNSNQKSSPKSDEFWSVNRLFIDPGVLGKQKKI